MDSASVPAVAVERPCLERLVEHIMVDKKSGLYGLSRWLAGKYAAASRDLAEIPILFHG